MNKKEFVAYVSKQNDITQKAAEPMIDMFISSTISALGEGKEISLVGFGTFSVRKVDAKAGRNPQTGASIQIKAYNQPRFKSGQKLKEACNNK